jgi:hypothetical protein
VRVQTDRTLTTWDDLGYFPEGTSGLVIAQIIYYVRPALDNGVERKASEVCISRNNDTDRLEASLAEDSS